MAIENRVYVIGSRNPLLVSLVLFLLLLLAIRVPEAEQYVGQREAVLVSLDMTIDGGALAYVERVLREYRGMVLVLKINSHGGYLSAADRIVTAIVESGVECYSWVPPGGYAVSAATMVALACKEVYMGPGSVVGAVKPVPWDPKIAEYVKGRLKGLLERQGKSNLTYIVDEMVDNAKTLTAEEAQRLGFARFADGLEVLAAEENVKLVRADAPNSWERLLSLLSNQVVAELLLFVGVLLVLVEVFTTGFQGYGIAGALLIVLGLYSLALVPVDILYLALVIAGAILLAIELYTPGFGLFGISGMILAAVGFAMALINQPPEVMSPPVYAMIGGFAALGGLVVLIGFSAARVARIRRKPISEQLVGAVGIAKTDVGEVQPGVVYVAGEDWTAFSIRGLIPGGKRVRVVRVEGLKLYVEPVEES